MNVNEQSNAYSMYVGVGVICVATSYFLFDRIVAWCKKEKMQVKVDHERVVPGTLIGKRVARRSLVLGLDVKEVKQPDRTNEAQARIYSNVEYFYENRCIGAMGDIQDMMQDGEISDASTAEYLAELLMNELTAIGKLENIDNILIQPSPEEARKRVIQNGILEVLLKELLNLNKIENDKIFDDLARCLLATIENTGDKGIDNILVLLNLFILKINDNKLLWDISESINKIAINEGGSRRAIFIDTMISDLFFRNPLFKEYSLARGAESQ